VCCACGVEQVEIPITLSGLLLLETMQQPIAFNKPSNLGLCAVSGYDTPLTAFWRCEPPVVTISTRDIIESILPGMPLAR
jgi:hypothetical protein